MRINNLVLIEWLDSNFEHGWLSVNKLSGILVLTESVGFIVAEDENKISIAQNKSELDTYMGIMTIPKPCIITKKKLRIR